MSENRETPLPGAPVEEEESSQTDVLAAARRATGAEGENGAAAPEEAAGIDAAGVQAAGSAEVAEASANPQAEELRRREAIAQVDTELDIELPSSERTPIVELEEMPSAAADPEEKPARDGEIRISADDPMAAFYTQTALPPEARGNRLGGTLIAALATIVFAAVYAGVIALSLAPFYPPSTFLAEGLMPSLLSLTFGLPILAFFLGLLLLVLIFNRAGWWVYVLGGFLVAVAVWAAAVLGSALQARFVEGERVVWDGLVLARDFGLTAAALGAAVAAREVSVWFGAWIGGRGRRLKRRNAEELVEYEEALAETQANGA